MRLLAWGRAGARPRPHRGARDGRRGERRDGDGDSMRDATRQGTAARPRPYRGARDGRRGTYPVRENLFDTESYDGNVGERSGGDGEHRQLFQYTDRCNAIDEQGAQASP